ncbi:hypothetical protein A2957_01870 [Candidatus Roizmanbacteria bacterium RIFCSPLOWO2_01_FULL_38_11]|uniref:Dihydroorotate dehydrogenase catalytic domain-containing protein n=1 Tax=Candidatus Roizmanbacteria bacterium RIFCSPLOWO2_01_FULL_38_11 TaxID=1802060 RepID=A0A1F7IKH7_9BACT|nr:MAG: hypothetical protein A2957_01870 [Candidatus Roizmanbacteria bacterium RIFCSPLOWO2_01_FULL_38_11]
MLHKPFYDPQKSYEDNYDSGPFGTFIDGRIFNQTGEPNNVFLGQKVYLPFGIPAGPILNSNFVKSSFEKGFDLVVYKTVRSLYYPCHPFPNVLSVDVDQLTLERAKQPLIADTTYKEPLSITNSFGVPSKEPAVWQEDVKKAISYEGKGQALILSFMGTVKEHQTEKEFIDDFVLAARLSLETGAKLLEVNLSCPNIGNEGLVCYNDTVSEKVLKGIKKTIGDIPLIVKIGYFDDGDKLKGFIKQTAPYADAYSAINTIAAPVVDKNGEQALPGNPVRFRSGICGASIKWAGLDMVKRLNRIRSDSNYSYRIIGVGGITQPEDYFEARNAGADAVMSATGAMWNPFLAQEVKTLKKS